MNPLPLPLLPPPAQFVDLRPSDTLLVMKSMQWLNHISPRLFLFMKTFFRLLRNLTPDGTLEKVFHLFFLHKALNQLQAIWPLINPIAKISKALYYEFEVAGPTNEHRWIEHWLLTRPSMLKEHRQVQVSTGHKLSNSAIRAGPGESSDLQGIREELGYVGFPYPNAATWFTYKGGLFRVKLQCYGPPPPKMENDQNGQNDTHLRPRGIPDAHDDSDFVIRLYATSRAPFLLWLAEAKRSFEAANPPVIRITRFIGSHVTGVPLWGAWSKRQKRNLEDIILTEETKIKLDNLISDFLKSGRWYSNRGLSWKKGFLLHGPPGCGKTSTIIGLASKYNLKIYYLSLNHPFLTDESLVEAIRQVHQRSIICLEDCDIWAKAHNRRLAEKAAAAAALSAAASGITPSAHAQPGVHMPPAPGDNKAYHRMPGFRTPPPPPPPPPPPESRLTLTGLLNVLDGVEEQRGILYILTSNDPSSLDAALIRPGRIDEIIELKYATKQQAEDLFNTFYKPYDEESPAYNLKEVASWAKKFSSCISDGEFSPASLQTFLLQYRLDPAGAVTAFPEWTRKQREDKAFTSLAHTPVVKEPTKLEGAEGEKGKENQSCQCGCIANDDE